MDELRKNEVDDYNTPLTTELCKRFERLELPFVGYEGLFGSGGRQMRNVDTRLLLELDLYTVRVFWWHFWRWWKPLYPSHEQKTA
jgi:hypothetical protein